MTSPPFDNIGLIGVGQMGRGIAQVAAMAGLEVRLFDHSQEALNVGLAVLKGHLEKGAKRGKWTQEAKDKALSHLVPIQDLSELKGAPFILEAITENKALKLDLFKRLDRVAAPHTILASNTSSLSITELATATKRPNLVVGMHFMNPVPVMELVEGIEGLETSKETFSLMESLALSMGKTVIKVSDIPGFAINRILMPMINEAIYALMEGLASREDIDRGMKLGTRTPMGPLELADFIGLDTCLAILNILHKELGEKFRPCPLLKQYVLAGRLGKKVGRGFYTHT